MKIVWNWFLTSEDLALRGRFKEARGRNTNKDGSPFSEVLEWTASYI